jgi:hypothetical protein
MQFQAAAVRQKAGYNQALVQPRDIRKNAQPVF